MNAKKLCTGCKTPIDADATFCGACGHRQPQPAAAPIPRTIIRPPPSHGPPPAQAPSAPQPQAGGSSGGLWIFMVVLLAVGGLGGAAYLFKDPLTALIFKNDSGDEVSPIRTVLLSRDVEPSDKDQKLGTGELAVTLPLGFSDKKERLTLARVENVAVPDSDAKPTRGYEVTLGNRHRFRSPIQVHFDHKAPGPRPLCVSSSRRKGKTIWRAVPCRAEGDRISITTNHLSIFSVIRATAPKLGPRMKIGYIRYPSGRFLEPKEQLRLLRQGPTTGAIAGWNHAMRWFGFGGASSTLAEHLLEIPGASRLNKHMPELGMLFAFAQAAIDFAEGNSNKAVLNLLKSITNYAAGKAVNTRAMNLAFVGVFAIDYALSTFAERAIEGRFKLYERAYELHYRKHNANKDAVYWYKRLSALMGRLRPGDDVSAKIRSELHNHVQAFWKNPETVAAYLDRVMKDKHRFTGLAGLHKRRVQNRISHNQLRKLRQRLTSALNVLYREVAWHYQDMAHRALRRVKRRLNRVHHIEVAVKGGETDDPKQTKTEITGLAVRIPVANKAEQSKWEGVTDQDGIFKLRCTSLGYAMMGNPKRIELTVVRGPEGTKETLMEPLTLNPAGKPTRVIFDLSKPKIGGRWKMELVHTYLQMRGQSVPSVVGRRSSMTIDLSQPWRVGKDGSYTTLTSPGSGQVKLWIRFSGNDRFKGRYEARRPRGFLLKATISARRLP